MALITPGYWQSTYWPSQYWQEDYWPEYGTLVPPVTIPQPSVGKFRKRKKGSLIALVALKDYLELKLSEA